MYGSTDKATINRKFWKNPITAIVAISKINLAIVKSILVSKPFRIVSMFFLTLLIMVCSTVALIVKVRQDNAARPKYELLKIDKINETSFLIKVHNVNPLTEEHWPGEYSKEALMVVTKLSGVYAGWHIEHISSVNNYAAEDVAEELAEAAFREERRKEYNKIIEQK